MKFSNDTRQCQLISIAVLDVLINLLMVKYMFSLQLSADYSRMWKIVFVGVCCALFGVKGDAIDGKKTTKKACKISLAA